MVYGYVICLKVFVSRNPVDYELFLFYLVFDLMETHVNGFGSFMFDSVVDESNCSEVFGLHWCGRLIVSHFFRETRMDTVSLVARKVAPTSASMEEFMTVLIIFARTWTAPLGCGVLVDVVPGGVGCELRKKNVLRDRMHRLQVGCAII